MFKVSNHTNDFPLLIDKKVNTFHSKDVVVKPGLRRFIATQFQLGTQITPKDSYIFKTLTVKNECVLLLRRKNCSSDVTVIMIDDNLCDDTSYNCTVHCMKNNFRYSYEYSPKFLLFPISLASFHVLPASPQLHGGPHPLSTHHRIIFVSQL